MLGPLTTVFTPAPTCTIVTAAADVPGDTQLRFWAFGVSHVSTLVRYGLNQCRRLVVPQDIAPGLISLAAGPRSQRELLPHLVSCTIGKYGINYASISLLTLHF